MIEDGAEPLQIRFSKNSIKGTRPANVLQNVADAGAPEPLEVGFSERGAVPCFRYPKDPRPGVFLMEHAGASVGAQEGPPCRR